MIKCLEACKKLNVECPVESCRYWVDYASDKNCTFESISKNDAMTLREVGERLNISYVRVKQIQDKALKKISHLLK
jgi:hypothetical protein